MPGLGMGSWLRTAIAATVVDSLASMAVGPFLEKAAALLKLHQLHRTQLSVSLPASSTQSLMLTASIIHSGCCSAT
jgi:hypothetical protein